MIDFHSHILPGIDDGAKSVEESLSLLGELSRQGVDAVVLSSHYYGRRRNIRTFLGEYGQAYQTLSGAYTGEIRLLRGAECNIATCANSDFGEFRAITVGGSKYLLTELSFEKKWTDLLWERVDNLLIAGITPVIAHVELYPPVRKHPDLAVRLKEMGCLLQVNCDSFLDRKYKKVLNFLFENGLPDCLGTDAHNMVTRPPHYRAAEDVIVARYGQAAFDGLQKKMGDILQAPNGAI